MLKGNRLSNFMGSNFFSLKSNRKIIISLWLLCQGSMILPDFSSSQLINRVVSHPQRCFKERRVDPVAKSRPPRDSPVFATLPPSPLESRQLVEGIVARVHRVDIVSTRVSAEIDTFPAKLLERIARERRRRCSCFYSPVKTFSSSPFSFQNRKKTRCKRGRAGSSWQRRHTANDEACSINACTCELPSSRASTLDLRPRICFPFASVAIDGSFCSFSRF